MKEFFQTLPWRLSRIEFYKKKAFAVVLTVIFSVLLVLTIGIRIFVRDTDSTMFSRGTDSFDFSDVDSSELVEMFGEMPDGMSNDSGSDDGDSDSDSGTDMSGIPDGDFPGEMGEMPSGDTDGMPSGDFSGDTDGMPSGGMGDFSDGSDSSSDTSEDSDAAAGDGTAVASGATGIMGFVQGWRSHWLIFLILFAVADILCIVRLAILAHRKKEELLEEQKQAREQMLAGEVVHAVRPVKKHKTNPAVIWAIPMVGVLLLVAIVNAMTARSVVSASQTEATVYSGTAETVSMDTILPGSGTLEEEDAVEIELLSDVEISKWYVSDGDTVEEGDQLALVDSVSVMSAIASLQEQLDALDEELADCEDEEISETITAAADGRVMAIYAEEDTAVTDTMYEYGALMLISLDGYLCMSVESDADLSAGDAVVITLSDNTTTDGKVSSVLGGTITILVPDEEASPGETASAATEDGEELGEGTLSIHSALSVTGYAGTVSEIEVSVGDEVESGDTLLTLTDTEYTGTYEQLLAERSELEEAMQELFVLYQDPYLYAVCDGVVSGIDDSSAAVTVEENVISTSTSSGTTALDGANISETDNSSYTNLIGVVTSIADGTATVSYLPDTYTISDYTDLSDIDMDTSAMTETGTLQTSSSYLMFTYTGSSFAIGTAADLAEGDTIILAYDTAGDLVWIVKVDVTEESAGSSTDSSGSSSGTDSSSGSGSSSGSDSSSGTGSSGSAGNSYGSSSSGSDSGASAGGSSSGSTDSSANSILGSISDYGSTDSSSDNTTGSGGASTDSSTADLSTLTGDTTGASDSSSADGSAAEDAAGGYSVSRTTAVSITPQDTMSITITVDELDILSLKVGQTAQVTLDAFPGQSFEGEVTSIDLSGTNSGGSTKFTAVVTIDRETDMLAGMNASAGIVLDTTEDVLCIPEAALVEEDGAVCVYTSYDEETDTLGDPVEVTTGISDGENVEILSGLSEGDTYYYSYLDVVNYSTSSTSSGSGSFSMESLFSSGGGGGGMSMP